MVYVVVGSGVGLGICVRSMTIYDGVFFFLQAEDGIRDFCLSRGRGDVYK